MKQDDMKHNDQRTGGQGDSNQADHQHGGDRSGDGTRNDDRSMRRGDDDNTEGEER